MIRLGQILNATPRAEGKRGLGRPKIGGYLRYPPKSDAPSYAELGLSQREARQAKRAAKLSSELQKEFINLVCGFGILSRYSDKLRKKASLKYQFDGLDIRRGDFREVLADVKDQSVKDGLYKRAAEITGLTEGTLRDFKYLSEMYKLSVRTDKLYERAAKITGLSEQTLRIYKSLSEQFEFSRRREGLGYSHHCEVASIKQIATNKKGKLYLSAEPGRDKIAELLADAERKSWSVGQLRNFKSMADCFELSQRCDKLGWSHHREVSSIKPLAERLGVARETVRDWFKPKGTNAGAGNTSARPDARVIADWQE